MEVFDQNGCSLQLPQVLVLNLEQALAQALAKDKALGITRNRIPFRCILLPNKPQTGNFCELVQAIRDIAHFDVAPNNRNQGIWMRCVQLYWEAKSILLANKIFKLIPDPTLADGYLRYLLPPQAFANLLLETDADKALYDLLEAGESEICSWAKAKGIDYPNTCVVELFIYILKARFETNELGLAFSLIPSWQNKRAYKEYYRRHLKFLSDLYSGDAIEKQYEKEFMEMGWPGYVLLALRSKKTHKPWFKLWQSYLKTHRKAIKLIDSQIYWKDDNFYQNRRTSQRLPIVGVVTDEGYFNWAWGEEKEHISSRHQRMKR
ncbi:MAG: hypothetical protein DSM106950_41135 [Stigonema ocellatum SAG 48.90 = DSM 106950]|nr:hypothetical protein [Stigonema ocellatum SAG 48.90 = DSM 106950]